MSERETHSERLFNVRKIIRTGDGTKPHEITGNQDVIEIYRWFISMNRGRTQFYYVIVQLINDQFQMQRLCSFE
jgi:hypothetical protein